MKKIIILIILLTNFIGYSQCPAPSNLTSFGNISEATLSWTEEGTATAWEIVIMPNYEIGTPLPTSGGIYVTTNPSTLINLLPGCNVFFVRSVCSATEVSPWAAVATSGCSTAIYNYLETLSTDNFSENNPLTIFPNPTKNLLQIKSDSEIEKIRIIDSLGKILLVQTQNNTEINVEHLSKGIYTLEISTGNGKIFRKFIKE